MTSSPKDAKRPAPTSNPMTISSVVQIKFDAANDGAWK